VGTETNSHLNEQRAQHKPPLLSFVPDHVASNNIESPHEEVKTSSLHSAVMECLPVDFRAKRNLLAHLEAEKLQARPAI
jgi:hypothetical protein